MEFSIKEYKEYNEKEILNLYQSVGWTNYVNNPAMLKNAYANSLKIFGAYEVERKALSTTEFECLLKQADGCKNEKLLGIIRCVGDGYSIVFIQDIIVLPEYQHQGIGTALLRKTLEIYKNVYQKNLLTDYTEKNIGFYKSVGFEMDTDIGCRAFTKVY